jgi:hypothetical protein
MKRSRFYCILIRGPPKGQGRFNGVPASSRRPFLFQGMWQNGYCTRLLTGDRTAVASLTQGSPVGVRVQIPSSPPLLLYIHAPGLAELADALGLEPSWGCPVGRSPSPCEFNSRAPDHFPFYHLGIRPSRTSFYLTQGIALSIIMTWIRKRRNTALATPTS